MVLHHVGQAGLELLTSGDPPALAYQSARITVSLLKMPGTATSKKEKVPEVGIVQEPLPLDWDSTTVSGLNPDLVPGLLPKVREQGEQGKARASIGEETTAGGRADLREESATCFQNLLWPGEHYVQGCT
ncbi:hypothetical protein AAY473_000125 [Plecturocebus cupreus]